MAKITAIHSFRGGTGKSNTTANIAALIAAEGMRVGVVDTDIQSPGIHVLFRFDPNRATYSLNDYLWGKCDIVHTAHDVTSLVDSRMGGKIYLIPSSVKTGDIARVLHYGYDVNLLRDGFLKLIDSLALDYLFIDTHPGLNEETLLSIALSDTMVIILRPDQQDYQGTAVTVEISRQLDLPRILLVLNKVPPSWDRKALAAKVAETYGCEVAGVLPHSDDMMTLASAGIFVTQYRDHPLTREFEAIARKIGEA